jgi:hypothetical protein
MNQKELRPPFRMLPAVMAQDTALADSLLWKAVASTELSLVGSQDPCSSPELPAVKRIESLGKYI